MASSIEKEVQEIQQQLESVTQKLRIEPASEPILSALNIIGASYTSFSKWKTTVEALSAAEKANAENSKGFRDAIRKGADKTKILKGIEKTVAKDKWAEVHKFIERSLKNQSVREHPGGGIVVLMRMAIGQLNMIERDILKLKQGGKDEMDKAAQQLVTEAAHAGDAVRSMVFCHKLASELHQDKLLNATSNALEKEKPPAYDSSTWKEIEMPEELQAKIRRLTGRRH